MTTNLTPDQLRDPAVMLETLRASYQFILDVGVASTGRERSHRSWGMTRKRLSAARQRELGRRLAFYWSEKP